MKHRMMWMEIASPALLTGVFLALVLAVALAVPASAATLYSNGPVDGSTKSWTIDFGDIVSDDFTLTANSMVTEFTFGAWYFPGDTPETVNWSITSAANGGTVYGSGTGSLSNAFLFLNPEGYDVGDETVTGLDVDLTGGVYWLNLQGATTAIGEPLYWDQNKGAGCTSTGCPSAGFDNAQGKIPSESFTIDGTIIAPTPEPGSLTLLASGIVGIACVLRRRRRSWGAA